MCSKLIDAYMRVPEEAFKWMERNGMAGPGWVVVDYRPGANVNSRCVCVFVYEPRCPHLIKQQYCGIPKDGQSERARDVYLLEGVSLLLLRMR